MSEINHELDLPHLSTARAPARGVEHTVPPRLIIINSSGVQLAHQEVDPEAPPSTNRMIQTQLTVMTLIT